MLGCCSYRAAVSHIAFQIQAVLRPLGGLPADIIAVQDWFREFELENQYCREG